MENMEDTEMIKVLRLRAGDLEPVIEIIPHTLENLQGLVGGWLDVVRAGG